MTVLLSLSQCHTNEIDFSDIELPNYTGEVVVPLGTATYTVADLLTDLEDESLEIDTAQSGLLSLIYRDTTTFTNTDEVIVINDVSNNGFIDSPVEIIGATPSEVGDVEFTQDLEFLYPIDGGDQLDSINYSMGQITITYESDFDVPLSFSMVIDDIIDRATGNPLVLTGIAAPNGSGNQSQSLVNHKTIARQNNSNENSFTGTFLGTLDVGAGDNVYTTDQFRYTIDITGADFETIYGYFGEKNYDLFDQSIAMDFFDQLDGEIKFSSPEVRIIVDNSFGLTMGLNLSNISTSNANSSQTLTGSVTEQLQFINGPDIYSVGSSRTSSVRINNTNSNIADLFSISPNMVNLTINAQSNYSNSPNRVPEDDRNFTDQNSTASTIVEVELPLNLQLRQLTRHIDYSLSDFSFDQADTINLRIKTNNRLPMSGTLDLQFLDADSAVVYESKNVSIFTSPEVPAGSNINEPVVNIDFIPLFGEGLDALFNQPTIRIVIHVDSYDVENDTYVKIFADYALEILLGVEATLDVEL
ncbi:hypothetical protein N6H18_07240 [Reichenbachiella agarivorans]|uniref:DUF4270 family protein n=1 Tax=Reichenbachiella agarivorans TaxID=2979464 RepID=A0ABY6CT94_9BACT|nr:hypothetical protein [Reichenbachiella agarivorans]UXP33746.1 hypothetical protein N6H18_07240 [Reichenbachiella agarivorans]